MTGWFWAGLVTGLAANECCQLSEWTARRLVRWSAYIRYEDQERAEVRAEELVRVIADRPCQLLKLFTAAWFVITATQAWFSRRTAAGPLVADISGSGAATLRATVAIAVTTTIALAAALTVYTAQSVPPNGTTGPSVTDVENYARTLAAAQGWGSLQFACLSNIWVRESGWRWNATNASGAYGIPQSLPGSKMATAGADWQTNPATQIKWGLGYIQSIYGTPCNAWSFWQAHGFY